MAAWLETQRELMAGPRPPAIQEIAERLRTFGDDYAGMAADYFRSVGSPGGIDAMSPGLIDRYRRLFVPDPAIADARTSARYQAALHRSGELAAAIAVDAFKRLSAELSISDPAAPPVTSLKQLHELWIECGEAAWAAAAHREDFAEAQAELLGSLVELHLEHER